MESEITESEEKAALDSFLAKRVAYLDHELLHLAKQVRQLEHLTSALAREAERAGGAGGAAFDHLASIRERIIIDASQRHPKDDRAAVAYAERMIALLTGAPTAARPTEPVASPTPGLDLTPRCAARGTDADNPHVAAAMAAHEARS